MNDTVEIKYLSGGNGSEDTHSHDCHQILFVTDGTALLSLNGTERTITSGDVIAVSRFEEHSVSKQSARLYKIHFENCSELRISMRIETVRFCFELPSVL